MNNEPETITLYDKPAIDPGEGWRIYDQDKEGLEPRPDAEYYCGGKWFKRACPEDRMTLKDVYRVPITQQPDRLTELRQQGERQAARIVELEEKLQKADDFTQVAMDTKRDMQREIAQRDEQIDGLRSMLAKRADEVESLQTQVRSAEEALRVEKQRCDSTSIELDDVCCERDNLKDRIKELETIAAPDLGCIESQARAWDEVCQTLTSVMPEWHQLKATGKESACEAIQRLYRISKPLRWERRKPTEEECNTKTFLWISRTDCTYVAKPGEYLPGDFYDNELICIFHPIAGPEPEPKPKMVIKRRWLCHNGSHSWVEVWPDDGKEPTDQWVERVRTDMTREVPE